MDSNSSFILDCDTGRDDALTLWLFQRLNLNLAAVVSSYGNVSHAQVIDNNARVLDFAGMDNVRLFQGATEASKRHNNYDAVVLHRHRTLGNGLSDVILPEAKRTAEPWDNFLPWLENHVAAHGKIDYVITGPATNCARLLGVLGTRATDYINTITMMGGKFAPLWDQLPGADFNVCADPYAVQKLLDGDIPVRFLPMNTTWPIYCDLPAGEALVPADDLAAYAKQMMVGHMKHFAPEPVFRFHDPGILFAMMHPEYFTEMQLKVYMGEDSPNFARLMPDDTAKPVSIYNADAGVQLDFKNRILTALGLTPHA